MKKIILTYVLLLLLLSNNLIYATANNEIYKKIDLIYEKSPNKLQIISDKVKLLLTKNINNTQKNILKELNDYINYKFWNEDFYKERVSSIIKIKVKNIYNNSFTDSDNIEKLEKLLNDDNLSMINKEYIKYGILDKKVSLLLNHQNFDEAKKITIDYFKLDNTYNYNKLNFITKNIDYSSFWILTQLVSWINPKKKADIIDYRAKYFPNENNTAWNVVRKSWYNQKDCEKLDILDLNRDLIDKKFCKLLSWKFEPKDLEDVNKLNNNLQNLSDRINYYTYIEQYLPEYKEKMENQNKDMWEIIIKNDKNFVNWYLALLHYYDNKKDCEKFNEYSKQLWDNYIWDIERKDILSKRKYINCSLWH